MGMRFYFFVVMRCMRSEKTFDFSWGCMHACVEDDREKMIKKKNLLYMH